MGEKRVRFSDLSGRMVDGGDELVRLVVLEHPDLDGAPVELEALPQEVTPALDAALNVAVIELHRAGGDVERMVLEAENFDALAVDAPMAALLKNAPTISTKRRTVAAGTNGQRIDYATLEHAGTPHRGKVTAEEAAIVREHLAEVNARLAAAGVRRIDPTNPDHASRYGLTAPAA